MARDRIKIGIKQVSAPISHSGNGFPEFGLTTQKTGGRLPKPAKWQEPCLLAGRIGNCLENRPFDAPPGSDSPPGSAGPGRNERAGRTPQIEGLSLICEGKVHPSAPLEEADTPEHAAGTGVSRRSPDPGSRTQEHPEPGVASNGERRTPTSENSEHRIDARLEAGVLGRATRKAAHRRVIEGRFGRTD